MVMADQAVFSGNSFIATILIARVFGPKDFGIYAAILLFIFLVMSILSSIIVQPLQVTLARVEKKHSYISFSFWLQVVLVALTALLVVSTLQLKIALFVSYQHLALGIVFLMVGYIMHDFFRKIFLASGRVRSVLLIDILSSSTQMSILLLSLFVITPSFEQLIILSLLP